MLSFCEPELPTDIAKTTLILYPPPVESDVVRGYASLDDSPPPTVGALVTVH